MHTLVDAGYKPLYSTKTKRPLFLVSVPAGFPSPADDYLEGALNLNEYLIKHKAATFFWRAIGSLASVAASPPALPTTPSADASARPSTA
jgi:DNA polymerase V